MSLKKYFNYTVYLYRLLKTALFYKPFFKKSGKRNVIIKPLIISCKSISLGNYVLVRNFARIEAVYVYQGGNYDPSITIGNNVSIEQNMHLTCAGNINIGNNTAIAANVTITDINHGYENIDLPPEMQPLDVSNVVIGEDCKIYNNAVILAGSTLGKHTVVAANSVVAGVFPDYCVLAGAPARIIRKYNHQTKSW